MTMASPLPLARDAVFVCAGADSAQRSITVGSPDWYDWLSEIDHRSFQFASEAGGFTARKERKQRGSWYWIAYRRFQGNVHKSYLGKSEEVTLARLQDAATILAARIEVLGAPLDRSSP